MNDKEYILLEGDASGGEPTLLQAETRESEQTKLDEISAKLDVLLQANGISLGE